MKKIYSKPEIMFDSFTLTTNIAAGCKHRIDTFANGSCGLFFPHVGNVFTTGVSGCNDMQVSPDDDQYGGICYHVPYEDSKLFNS